MNSVTVLCVTQEMAGQRLDNFLFNYLKGVPKSRVYSMIRKGEVRINNKRVKHHIKISPKDLVRIPPVSLDKKQTQSLLKKSDQEKLKQSILFQDNKLLVINKPAGWAVHGGSGVSLGIIEGLRQLFPEETGLELIHRLDRETSGCLLIAKKRSMLRGVHESLRSNQVLKSYLLLVEGYWPKSLKMVDEPLKKNVLSSGERIVRVDPCGKPSQTEFEIIQRFERCTLLRAWPKTGRTHQIRVHAACAGFPIVGDEKYQSGSPAIKLSQLGSRRFFLHCESITLPGEQFSDYTTFTAPMDKNLRQILAQLETSN